VQQFEIRWRHLHRPKKLTAACLTLASSAG
jgi:hypothetical protein